MAQSDDVSRLKAERHLARAKIYLDDAKLLRGRANFDSAGALMYESAKQCINAVANQQGQNPAQTRDKFLFLKALSSQPPVGDFDLMRGWQAAMALHIHADQGHLTEEEFGEAWTVAGAFMCDMLSVYSGETELDFVHSSGVG